MLIVVTFSDTSKKFHISVGLQYLDRKINIIEMFAGDILSVENADLVG